MELINPTLAVVGLNCAVVLLNITLCWQLSRWRRGLRNQTRRLQQTEADIQLVLATTLTTLQQSQAWGGNLQSLLAQIQLYQHSLGQLLRILVLLEKYSQNWRSAR